jgi:phospholipase/carboxylesterase
MTSQLKDNSDSQASERTLNAEVKLYYDLDAPAEDARQKPPRPLLIALHGYGGNKRQMMREARMCAPPDFAVASLQGFHQHLKEPREEGAPLRFGFGWLTNFHPEDSIALHHTALLNLIDALTRDGVADPARIFLLGFSQSCALNYRFAFTHVETLRGVIGICGGLPGDWEISERYARTPASVLHLHGTQDEFYPPSRVVVYGEQLGERALDVEVKSYEAAHEITPAMRDDVRDWLESRTRR